MIAVTSFFTLPILLGAGPTALNMLGQGGPMPADSIVFAIARLAALTM